jgi:integrase/recombinase XerD
MSLPTIKIIVRHGADCPFAERGEEFRKCRCRKSVRWTDEKGVQHRESCRTRSWEGAEKYRRDLEKRLESGQDGRVTVDQAIDRFLETMSTRKAGKGVSRGVELKYKRELPRFAQFCEECGKTHMLDVILSDVTSYQARWEKLYPSLRTRVKVQGRLRTFLRFAFINGWLKQNISDPNVLEPFDADPAPANPLSPEEYEKLLATIPAVFTDANKAARVRALLQAMRYTGLAISDAVKLPRRAIESAGKMHYVRTFRKKTGSKVLVPIPPDIAKELLAVSNGDPEYLFWNTGNGELSTAVTNWQHDLRALFRRAFGADTDFTPHCLRDTAATSWLADGIPLEEVSAMLGHSSTKITQRHYEDWTKQRQERLDDLMRAMWAKNKQSLKPKRIR